MNQVFTQEGYLDDKCASRERVTGGKVRGPNSTEEARHISVIPINFVFSSVSIFVICLFRLLANARLVYGSIADYTYYPFSLCGLHHLRNAKRSSCDFGTARQKKEKERNKKNAKGIKTGGEGKNKDF